MTKGNRERGASQERLWVPGADLPRRAGHPFYERLSAILEAAGFDDFVESACSRFFAERMGRPSLAPALYFRLLLVGYFEGLDSERGIAWRAQDSLSVRRFLALGVSERAPDHSTISRTRRRIDAETHSKVFGWVRRVLAEAGLVSGRTVDSRTLEANPSRRCVVRRDAAADYDTFVGGLAEASGVATPARAELARFDDKREKKLSNDDRENTPPAAGRDAAGGPQDLSALVTEMKDSRPHVASRAEQVVCFPPWLPVLPSRPSDLAYKAEREVSFPPWLPVLPRGRSHVAYKAAQAADTESGRIVGVTVQGGSTGKAESIDETGTSAMVEYGDAATVKDGCSAAIEVGDAAAIGEIVADTRDHSNDFLASIDSRGGLFRGKALSWETRENLWLALTLLVGVPLYVLNLVESFAIIPYHFGGMVQSLVEFGELLRRIGGALVPGL